MILWAKRESKREQKPLVCLHRGTQVLPFRSGTVYLWSNHRKHWLMMDQCGRKQERIMLSHLPLLLSFSLVLLETEQNGSSY